MQTKLEGYRFEVVWPRLLSLVRGGEDHISVPEVSLLYDLVRRE